MPNKGCGTCRDRKVLCDRAVPVCQRCSRASRVCQGYGLRLSWPKEHDRRRAIVGTPSVQRRTAPKLSRVRMINTFLWDFQLQDYVSTAVHNGGGRLWPPVIPVSVDWWPFNLNSAEKDLLQYFSSVAPYSLTPLGYSPAHIRGVLLRIALSDSTAPTRAVMQSLLGLASLHRFGPQSHAARLKISALRTLSTSLTSSITTREGMQYIAASMLLCSYEAQQSSNASGEWLSHVRGAKDIISSVMLDSSSRDTDFIPLMDWVFYHDTMSRFSIRHWQRRHTTRSPDIVEPMIHEMWCVVKSTIPHSPQRIDSSRKILCFLSLACDHIFGCLDPRYNIEHHRSLLRMVYWEITRLPFAKFDLAAPSVEGEVCVACEMELYQLAALVYLERVAGGFPEGQSKASERIDRAFSLFGRLEAFERAFPLLIFACEAQDDDQRITILDLIARTQKNCSLHSLDLVESMIRSIWVQYDLADHEIEYVDLLNVILSSSGGLPTFV